MARSFVLVLVVILTHSVEADAGEEQRFPRHLRQPEKAVQKAPTLKPTPEGTIVQLMKVYTRLFPQIVLELHKQTLILLQR